jgi:hypothetical protein
LIKQYSQIVYVDYSDFCAVLTLGISANTVFAEDVTSETSSANSTGDETGLRKIEDGSVASNIHTAKWRVFTDKGRELFLQACSFFPVALV